MARLSSQSSDVPINRSVTAHRSPWIRQPCARDKSSMEKGRPVNTRSRMVSKLRDPAYRKAYVSSQINVGIPFQVRSLLKNRGWTQEQLSDRAGMLQPRISAILKPGRGGLNIETLRRLAEAFDCGLMVRFAPFSELIDWSEQFDPESFDVERFETEDKRGRLGHHPLPKSRNHSVTSKGFGEGRKGKIQESGKPKASAPQKKSA